MVDLNREYLVKKYGQEKLLKLTYIDVTRKKIRKIDPDTFKNLTNLEKLCLFCIEIEEIDVRLFESLSNLRKLDLYQNKLKRIDSNTFKNLTKLEELSLNNNEIEEIDVRAFESLSNLIELYLFNNKLKRIDSNTFKNLNKLEMLYLRDNAIEKIDVGLFESLSNLKELELSSNKLKRIEPNTFKNLTNLERLSMYNNAIEEIDVRLFESLSNLIELKLYNNKLKRIDSNTFKNLIKLMRLHLAGNAIEEINARTFENLSNLKELDLRFIKLKSIDSYAFKGLTRLEKLWLNDSTIEEIDARAFEDLSNLKKLDLYNNKLKEIDRKCFEPLKSIYVIALYENVGLNALSFIKPSADIWYVYDKEKVKKYGSVSEWNKFLQQFPDLEKQRREQEAREKEQREAFARLKIAEENNMSAKIEQDNANKSSYASVSSNQSTNKDKSKRFQDPYIGEFLNDRYKVMRKLGKGAFGAVYLVDDTKIDIKKVKEKAMKIMDQLDSSTENELELFSEINHDNIVRYFDHFHMRIEGQFQTFLITEFCQNGDLRNKIEETKRLKRNFDDRQILNWICQATNALKYLHSKIPDPIIHRDIKPANMLLSGRNEIKLGDLGLSKIMNNTHASTHAGTPLYMSPEVFKAQFMAIKYYPNVDIWSLGCVLYELIFLTYAFPRGQYGDPPTPSNVSSSGIFSSVLPKMLEKDCLVRITSRRLLIELEDLFDNENHSTKF